MQVEKVIYIDKQKMKTVFEAIDILNEFYEEAKKIDQELADELDESLFHLGRFLKGFRKYVKPKEDGCQMSNYIIIRIDRHESRKTGAFTRWSFSGPARMIYSTYEPGKTHWVEYWEVESGSIARRFRRSNRGNIYSQEFPVEKLRINEAEEMMLKELLEAEE